MCPVITRYCVSRDGESWIRAARIADLDMIRSFSMERPVGSRVTRRICGLSQTSSEIKRAVDEARTYDQASW
jgi:hypothetical protein